ncbi:MAG: PIG-L family deacetylase, partial [Candidatus Moranbacteria bacterium]|nr:PIG-L family deacetylase [Candidatus Moranbacteria bacterium]
MKTKILVVAAHPDDEVLGCGGTMARFAEQGAEIYSIILGEGITSRDNNRDTLHRIQDLSELKDHAKMANKILGANEVFFGDFPDNRFDTV